MAKSYKNQSIVSGMTINDVLSMDIRTFNSLNLSDMRKVVGRLVSAGNKRLRSFERAGESSPATRYIEKSGGAFSTKGKSLNELRAEYVRAKNFLEAKTGTRKGWTKVKQETLKGLAKQGIDVSEDQYNQMWQIYEELKETSPEVAHRGMKYAVLRNVSDMLLYPSKSADEIIKAMNEQLTHIYEEQQELNDDFDGFSGFFEIE